MFNPYDESNHGGLLTGMQRTRTTAQGAVERGALGAVDASLAQSMKERVAAFRAGSQITAKLDLSQETIAALQQYMLKAFQPPTAASSDVEKQMFKFACGAALNSKQIKAFTNDLAVALKLRADLVLADADRAKMQAFLDSAPDQINAAQTAYEAGFASLSDAANKAEDAYDNFLDYVFKGMNLILRDNWSWMKGWDTIGKFPYNGLTSYYLTNALYAGYPIYVSDHWTPTVGTFIAETAITVAAVAAAVAAIVLSVGTATPAVAAGAAGAAAAAAAPWTFTGVAFATIGTGAVVAGVGTAGSIGIEKVRAALSKALWSNQGPITKSDMSDLFHNPKYFGLGQGPVLTPLPEANPPLEFKGKRIAGVVFNQDHTRSWWVSVRHGSWAFSPLPDQHTSLKYIGGQADVEQHLQGFLAQNRWNGAFISAVQNMADIWPTIKVFSEKVDQLKAQLLAYTSQVAQSDAIKETMSKGLTQALADLDSKYKFDGFYAGFADVIKAQGLCYADLLAQLTALQTAQDSVQQTMDQVNTSLNQAQVVTALLSTAKDDSVLAAKTAQAKAILDNANLLLKTADAVKAQGEAAIAKVSDDAAKITGYDQMGVTIPALLRNKIKDAVKKAQAAGNDFKAKEADLDALAAKVNQAMSKIAPAAGGEKTEEKPQAKAIGGAGLAAIAAVGGLAAFLALRK